MEQWRDVVDYEGLYQVSDLGRVRSVDRIVKHSRSGPTKRKGRILSLKPNSRFGHLAVNLCKEGKQRTVWVHRLVLLVYIGPCPASCECCHEDGNPSNNRISNLRWDTRSSNIHDTIKHGKGCGRRVRRSDGVEYVSMSNAARDTGVSRTSIWSICKGHRKSSSGYGWEYCND